MFILTIDSDNITEVKKTLQYFSKILDTKDIRFLTHLDGKELDAEAQFFPKQNFVSMWEFVHLNKDGTFKLVE